MINITITHYKVYNKDEHDTQMQSRMFYKARLIYSAVYCAPHWILKDFLEKIKFEFRTKSQNERCEIRTTLLAIYIQYLQGHIFSSLTFIEIN